MDLDTQNLVSAIHEQKDPLQKTINSRLFKDLDMSLKAKGMLTYVFEQPEGWQVTLLELMDFLYEGRTSVKCVMDELIEKGYGIRLNFYAQGSDGRLCGSKTQYLFFASKKKISELYEVSEDIIETYREAGYKFSKAVTYVDIEKKKKRKSAKRRTSKTPRIKKEKLGQLKTITHHDDEPDDDKTLRGAKGSADFLEYASLKIGNKSIVKNKSLLGTISSMKIGEKSVQQNRSKIGEISVDFDQQRKKSENPRETVRHKNLKVGAENPVLNPTVFSMEMDQISASSDTEKSVEIFQEPRAHAYINNNNIYIYKNLIIKDYIYTHAHARGVEIEVQPKADLQPKAESKLQIEAASVEDTSNKISETEPKASEKPLKSRLLKNGQHNIQYQSKKIFKCLESVAYLPEYLKIEFTKKYSEKLVSDSLRLIASMESKIIGGDLGKLKYLSAALKDSERYADSIKNLDKPTSLPSLIEIIKSKFVSGNVYNGYIVEIGEKGICLYPQGGNGFFQAEWKEGKDKINSLLGKLNMNIDIAA